MIAESRSRSRFAIAKRRSLSHQSFRRHQKQIIVELLKQSAEDFDLLKNSERVLRVKGWRKWSDSPLGEFLSVLLKARESEGTNEGLKISKILEEAERLSPTDWRSFRWGITKKLYEEVVFHAIKQK